MWETGALSGTLGRNEKKPGETPGFRIGGGEEEDRTPDLRIANATLSQLSYPPEEAKSYNMARRRGSPGRAGACDQAASRRNTQRAGSEACGA